jgi:hypothetical protein
MARERHQTRAPAGRVSDRDPSDPGRRAVELIQRGRMILDIAAADLQAAEAALGAFHATTWFFRNARAEAQRSWDRLRAEFGPAALERALVQPPLAMLTLRGGAEALLLIPIEGQTYRVEPVAGTPLAPVQWRLTRLHPPLEHGPYYACRLHDGATQCDCAEWTYRAAEPTEDHCKHLAALAALGWLDAAHRGGWGEP